MIHADENGCEYKGKVYDILAEIGAIAGDFFCTLQSNGTKKAIACDVILRAVLLGLLDDEDEGNKFPLDVTTEELIEAYRELMKEETPCAPT